MTWSILFWTAVIPSLPLVIPGASSLLALAGVLLVVSAVGLWFERDKGASELATKEFFEEAPLGCTA
jgi:hypothetical protein